MGRIGVRKVDSRVLDVVPGRVPFGWGVRAIFRHPEACRAWLKRLTEENSPEHFRKLQGVYQRLLSQVSRFQTFVSLGPGGGDTDSKLLSAVAKQSVIRYIPVDISEQLLEAACRQISNKFYIPVSVVGDYEEGLDFISEVVRPYLEGGVVVSVLGNGIGNADIGEKRLLHQLCELTKAGDFFLLSIATGRFSESVFDAKEQVVAWNSLKELLAGGIAMIADESYSTVVSELPARLEFMRGNSDVDGATSLEFWDRKTKSRILSVKRYNFDLFRDWAEQNFPMSTVGSEDILTPQGGVGIGSFLIRRL